MVCSHRGGGELGQRVRLQVWFWTWREVDEEVVDGPGGEGFGAVLALADGDVAHAQGGTVGNRSTRR